MAAAQVLNVANTVDGRVRGVDDKIAAVIDGTQQIFSHQKFVWPITRLDGIEARVVMQQAADGVDQMTRS